MWGDNAAPGFPGPAGHPGAGLRMTAVVLMVLAAGLALGGSFGTFTVYRSDYASAVHSTTTTAWRTDVVPAPEATASPSYVPLDGIPITVAVVLVLLSALVLVTTGRRPTGRVWGRSAGVGAAALLTGVVAEIWVTLIATGVQVAGQLATADLDPGDTASFGFGLGAWLELAAGGCAAVAAVLLLLSALREQRAFAPSYQSVPFHPAGPADRP